VSTDVLLLDAPSSKDTALCELSQILETCSAREIHIIAEIAKTTKLSLEKYKDG